MIDTQEVGALVDTGADYSLKKVTTPWQGTQVRTAGGHVTPVGICTARVTVRGCMFVVSFLVLPECSRDLIQGMDFLREHGATIDLRNRLVTFFTELATKKAKEENLRGELRISDDTVGVPPRAIILTSVTCDEPHWGQRVVEPNVSLILTLRVCAARGLAFLYDGRTEVLITNFSNEYRHLLRGKVIAHVDQVIEVAECFMCEETAPGAVTPKAVEGVDKLSPPAGR